MQHVQLLALSLFRKIASEEVEERLHLRVERLVALYHRCETCGGKEEADLLGSGVRYGVHEPIELVAHGLRSYAGCSAFEMLSTSKHIRYREHRV